MLTRAPKDALRQKLGWLVKQHISIVCLRDSKKVKKCFLKSRKRKLRGGTRTK